MLLKINVVNEGVFRVMRHTCIQPPPIRDVPFFMLSFFSQNPEPGMKIDKEFLDKL